MNSLNGNGSPPLRLLANELLAAGLCVVPATAQKHPNLKEWTSYQHHLPLPDEVDEWFSNPNARQYGLGFVCGIISGGLEVLDLDAKHDPTKTINSRAEVAIKAFSPGLWERVVIESTPSGGRHLYFRCSLPAKNLKLAFCLNADGKRMAVAETRGEGGFIVCAPTPGYVLIQGDLANPPLITDDERSALFAAARSLDTAPVVENPAPPPVNAKARTDFPANYVSPGDAYNSSEEWNPLICKHGWTPHHGNYWTRPGKKKSDGQSASWDVAAPRIFHVFTPNASPLEDGKNYSPFALFAQLECGGNFKLAAETLSKLGYGTPPKPEPVVPDDDLQAALDAKNEETSTAEPITEPDELKPPANQADLLARCDARAFSFSVTLFQPIPRFIINKAHVSTPGNLGNVIGQSKTCKSTYFEAMIAAAVAADIGTAQDCDCLGLSATKPNGLHLIHFDTEQSIYDHNQLIHRALKRSKATDCPIWLHSYCVTGFAISDCRNLVGMKLAEFHKCGGVYAVLLDGVGDLVVNVNDPEECNPFVTELHEFAIYYDTCILSAIHENPGQDIGKGRGHLGSQLERKAESNLRLKKADNIITVFSEKMRKGSILEKDGPRFSWDDTAQMHLSTDSVASTKDDVKRERLRDLFEGVVEHAGKDRFRFAELLKAIGEVTGTGKSAAEDRFTLMKKLGIIGKDLVGFWGAKRD